MSQSWAIALVVVGAGLITSLIVATWHLAALKVQIANLRTEMVKAIREHENEYHR